MSNKCDFKTVSDWYQSAILPTSDGGVYVTPNEARQLVNEFVSKGVQKCVNDSTIPYKKNIYYIPENKNPVSIYHAEIVEGAIQEAKRKAPTVGFSENDINEMKFTVKMGERLRLGKGNNDYYSLEGKNIVIRATVSKGHANNNVDITISAYKDGKYINLDTNTMNLVLTRIKNHPKDETLLDIPSDAENLTIKNESETPQSYWPRENRLCLWRGECKSIPENEHAQIYYKELLNEFDPSYDTTIMRKELLEFGLLAGKSEEEINNDINMRIKQRERVSAETRLKYINNSLGRAKNPQEVGQLLKTATTILKKYPDIRISLPSYKEACNLSFENMLKSAFMIEEINNDMYNLACKGGIPKAHVKKKMAEKALDLAIIRVNFVTSPELAKTIFDELKQVKIICKNTYFSKMEKGKQLIEKFQQKIAGWKKVDTSSEYVKALVETGLNWLKEN